MEARTDFHEAGIEFFSASGREAQTLMSELRSGRIVFCGMIPHASAKSTTAEKSSPQFTTALCTVALRQA